ncbi:hypothetical protein L210DRAFT_3503965 [Boletus edulis BED1]|uniref:Uncharacterized protein n=1 Tax=Boletus edulis BED1 TaxID=1328754 RepID=A0AAD4GFS9_BOLED|nr:hypothetical protein L210DRAFT_3503965 [Boletus edulis BED1]
MSQIGKWLVQIMVIGASIINSKLKNPWLDKLQEKSLCVGVMSSSSSTLYHFQHILADTILHNYLDTLNIEFLVYKISMHGCSSGLTLWTSWIHAQLRPLTMLVGGVGYAMTSVPALSSLEAENVAYINISESNYKVEQKESRISRMETTLDVVIGFRLSSPKNEHLKSVAMQKSPQVKHIQLVKLVEVWEQWFGWRVEARGDSVGREHQDMKGKLFQTFAKLQDSDTAFDGTPGAGPLQLLG